MNDDEFPETIEPFLNKLKKYKKKNRKQKLYGRKLGFLRHWETPVTEDNMEELTGPGARDAKDLGERMSKRYDALLPDLKDPAIKYASCRIISNNVG